MAVILHQTISNPFGSTPARPSCRLDEPFSFLDKAPDFDTISLDTVVRERTRQQSPASFLSVASAPPIRNNENLSPLAKLRDGTVPLRAISSQTPKSCEKDAFQGQIRPRNFTYQPLVRDVPFVEIEDDRDDVAENKLSSEEDSDAGNLLIKAESKPESGIHLISRPYTPAPSLHNTTQDKNTSVSKVKDAGYIQNGMVTPETGLLSRIRELRQQSAGRDAFMGEISPTPSEYLLHHQRLSDSSSGFVHSMKTASMTNASFSVHPRSSRLGRSTDSHMLFGSQPRGSLDSDRPLSSGSLDDAALRRGLRRQQIIDELVATEESYIADLKALAYLYSTLLASASSIPNRMRLAIQQNVDEILHVHEKLLQRFHNARLQAAARRWADTAVPERLGHHRRSHLRNSERGSHTRSSRTNRRTKSIDSADAAGHRPQQSGAAEPIDVYEITAIFKDAMKSFYAYEEYCANYEIIGHELQKHMPGIWPTYESGMESLARAIVAIDQRSINDKKGLTVGDLLIKPIQRITKYPLLLEQLLDSTPMTDAPGTRTELDLVLQAIRDVVQMVNLATDNHFARLAIQRRWLLQDRLNLSRLNISGEQFRTLGTIELCGVLHVAYQSIVTVSGGYALCVLFDEHLLVAFPIGSTGYFEAIAIIQLCDMKITSPTDGKGMQCVSTVFTWKASFACAGHFHELLFSGCSRTEEETWIAGIKGEFSDPVHHPSDTGMSVFTCLAIDLVSTGVVFTSQKSLSRESSIQRAATVAGRTSISQVIIRNTHNAQHLHEYRDSVTTTTTINRSQSHATTKRIPVIEPKRSERARLENSISDIWTKERLPFPGMVGSRGGQIIRASAGSLARKLSLASIHTPFSKGRTSSLSMASRKSYDLFSDAKSTFEIRRREPDYLQPSRMKPKDIPEVDDMRSVVGRMIGGGAPVARRDMIPGNRSTTGDRDRTNRISSVRDINPDDPASLFYEDFGRLQSHNGPIMADSIEYNEALVSGGINAAQTRRKKWSNPISRLRGLGSEAMSILQFNSSKG